MIEIKCPDNLDNHKKLLSLPRNPILFLAGGITGCSLWQSQMLKLLSRTDLVLINPRRDEFDISNSSLTEEQIEWEYQHLNLADTILFWFPCETLCPITLYELGTWANKPFWHKKKIFVGCHPSYVRKIDVVKQLSLSRPDIKVVFGLGELANQIISWERSQNAIKR